MFKYIVIAYTTGFFSVKYELISYSMYLKKNILLIIIFKTCIYDNDNILRIKQLIIT